MHLRGESAKKNREEKMEEEGTKCVCVSVFLWRDNLNSISRSSDGLFPVNYIVLYHPRASHTDVEVPERARCTLLYTRRQFLKASVG